MFLFLAVAILTPGCGGGGASRWVITITNVATVPATLRFVGGNVSITADIACSNGSAQGITATASLVAADQSVVAGPASMLWQSGTTFATILAAPANPSTEGLDQTYTLRIAASSPGLPDVLDESQQVVVQSAGPTPPLPPVPGG